jgi:hypothetical protein
MLKTIDILLGVSVVMLIVSMAVTVLTQFVVGVAQSRGRNLKRGLADLLQQIDPTLGRQIVENVSAAVLTHPLISSNRGRLGATIHREEFTKLLLDLSSGNAPSHVLQRLGEAAKSALDAALKRNGIEDPAKILDNVRALALQLEMTHPEFAAHERHATALMREANSKLVAKVNAWFDQTIDRVSERFANSTQLITVGCALVVAFTTQLDTVGLINHLSIDEKFRQALVEKAIETGNGFATVTPANAPALGEQTRVTALTGPQRAEIDALVDTGALRIPNGYSEWQARWADVSIPLFDVKLLGAGALGATPPKEKQQQVNFLGVLLSALLLSLGGPFWYNALKNLLRFRSLVATKDDAQRETRQTSQAAPPTKTAPGNPLAGEKGIVN